MVEPMVVQAQTHQVPALVSSPSTPDADRTAILQDSVAGLRWMVPGHLDWSRYVHPEECFGAIEILQRMSGTRTNWNAPSPLGDTLSTAVRETGRTCLANFSPRTIADRDAQSFLRDAVMLNDLPLVTSIVDARLSHAKTADNKVSVILDAITALETRSLARLALAESLALRVHMFGPEARAWVPTVLGTFQEASTQVVFDTAMLVRLQAPLIPLYSQLTHDERMKVGLPLSWMGNWLPLQEYRRLAPDSIHKLARTLSRSLGPDTIWMTSGEGLAEAADDMYPRYLAPLGHSVAPFTGGVWFTPGDTNGHPSLGYPRRGHVTLVINEYLGSGRPKKVEELCRRLYNRYANDGLDIVIIHKRTGFAWGDAPLIPDVETRLMRWYDHDYLKLPFPVAVYGVADAEVPQTLLIGRDGRQYASDGISQDESGIYLEPFIQRALSENP